MLRILYAVQGTGNGHISRARTLLPHFMQLAHVEVLISGTESQLNLPFPVKYTYKGLSFSVGKQGQIDYWKTLRKSNIRSLNRDIKSVPVEQYDLVINDFEPISARACLAKGVPCIGLSHQSAVIHPASPKPELSDFAGQWVLTHYAPTPISYGFHFQMYADGMFTPIIRDDILQASLSNDGHISVYLPAYSLQKMKSVFNLFPEQIWHVFSKEVKKPIREGNMHVFPTDYTLFNDSVTRCSGIICGAGFETPAEALYMKKKLLVIPLKGQYEQQCNAESLKQMGVPVLKRLRKKHRDIVAEWINNQQTVSVHYPDNANTVAQEIVKRYHQIIR